MNVRIKVKVVKIKVEVKDGVKDDTIQYRTIQFHTLANSLAIAFNGSPDTRSDQ